MTATFDYLKLSDQIASATRARELHILNAELPHFGFSPAQLKALHEKISDRFGALNQLAVGPITHGRFTLAPRAAASVLHTSGK